MQDSSSKKCGSTLPGEERQDKHFTFSQQEDVVCELVGLGLGLQQGHEDGGLLHVHKISQALHNQVGRGAVQPSRDFIQEQSVLGSDHHLACMNASLIDCWR